MSVDSEHILDASERAMIRQGLSVLVDKYEAEEKRVIKDLGSTPAEALLRDEKQNVLKLRAEFLEPGSKEEVEGSQEDMFEEPDVVNEQDSADDAEAFGDEDEGEVEEEEPEPWDEEPEPGQPQE